VWLKESKRYHIEETLLEVARANMQFNLAREVNEIDPVMQQNIAEL
jgi:hypothetical protein